MGNSVQDNFIIWELEIRFWSNFKMPNVGNFEKRNWPAVSISRVRKVHSFVCEIHIYCVCVFAHVHVYVVPSESRFSLFNMWVPWMEPCIVKDGLHQLSHLPSPNTGSFSMRVSKYFPWSVSRLADPPSNAKICWKRFSLWRVHLRAAP